MIKCQGIYEIDYKKEDEERIWHISNIEISKTCGSRCFTAFCHEIEKDLTFSWSKISSAKRYWIDILDEDNAQAESDGLFVLACMEDNHIGRRLAYIKKGKRFSQFGWALAYHLVPNICFDNKSGWKKDEGGTSDAPKGTISLFAHRGNARIDCSNSQLAKDEDGINYYLDDNWMEKRMIPVDINNRDQVEVLGRYDLFVYSEWNLGVHNDLVDSFLFPKTH